MGNNFSEFELYSLLKEQDTKLWDEYVSHPFVCQIGTGTLTRECFQRYLGQDYLFLIHFARAYGLAAYKSDNINDIRVAANAMIAIIDKEISLHLEYCQSWGLYKDHLESLDELTATIAYTRYVLEKGLQGDLVDLFVALAPCIIGYSEIGIRLANDQNKNLDNNTYSTWIAMYSGEEYQRVALQHAKTLDRLWVERAGQKRFDKLRKTFSQAVRLEINFWQMGLDGNL